MPHLHLISAVISCAMPTAAARCSSVRSVDDNRSTLDVQLQLQSLSWLTRLTNSDSESRTLSCTPTDPHSRFSLMLHLTSTHTHTHTVVTAIFPGEPGLASCLLILLLHLFLSWTSFWDRPKLSMSCLTQSHQVFFRHPLCLIPSTSHVTQHLTQIYISQAWKQNNLLLHGVQSRLLHTTIQA